MAIHKDDHSELDIDEWSDKENQQNHSFDLTLHKHLFVVLQCILECQKNERKRKEIKEIQRNESRKKKTFFYDSLSVVIDEWVLFV